MRHALRAGSCHHTRHQGYTFLELIVAIAIVAHLVGSLLPAVQNLRTSRNAVAATATLAEIRAAQAIFKSVDRDGDGVLEYAGSLRELVDAGLLDEDLLNGTRQGYTFETAARGPSSSSVAGYVYTATPMQQGQTGVRGFGGDAGGIVAQTCPPGEHFAIVNAVVTCVRDSDPALTLMRNPLGELTGLAAIDAMNLLTDGSAVNRARTLLTPEFGDQVDEEFDVDNDQRVAFEELLQADLLAMARRLAANQPLAGGGVPFGDDGDLDAILRRLQSRIRQQLALGAGDETEFQAAPLETAVGFPKAVLDLASLDRTHASVNLLLDLVHGLDPSPAAGEMTSLDPSTNLQRKIRLVDTVQAMYPLWEYRELSPLRDALGDVRKRADGNPNPADWVRGSAASQIVARVDATLALIGQGH